MFKITTRAVAGGRVGADMLAALCKDACTHHAACPEPDVLRKPLCSPKTCRVGRNATITLAAGAPDLEGLPFPVLVKMRLERVPRER